jgi:hypothetical protein
MRQKYPDDPSIVITPGVKVITYFSTNHLLSAALFARNTLRLEKRYVAHSSWYLARPKSLTPLNAEHLSYASSAVMASVAFLEAVINEFYYDIAHNPYSEARKQLGPEVTERITALWNQEIPRTARYPIMQKYDIALILAGKKALDKKTATFANVRCLIELRNALTHYEPEAVVTVPMEGCEMTVQSLSKKLKGKFALNPIHAGGEMPSFPHQCLGHSCSKWAVKSVRSYVRTFYEHIEIGRNWNHVESMLGTE